MKKLFSLAASILMAIFTVFLFMPVIFTMEYWKNIAPGVGEARLAWKMGVNIFELNTLIAIIIIIISILSTAILFVQFLGNKNEMLKILKFSPIATCLMFIVASIARFMSSKPDGEPAGTASWGKYGHYSYEPNWGFYIAIALVIIVALISFLIISGKIKDDDYVKVADTSHKISDADELKKFKDLLDSGVITQEEFDEKKKQLLGL